MKLIPLLLVSVLLAYFSERRSIMEIDGDGEEYFVQRDKLCWILLALCMAVLCGLRLKGNDTGLYRNMYIGYIPGDFRIEWWRIASAPGFTFVGIAIRSIGASVQDYLMIISIFTIGTYIWFIRKYTSNFTLSVFYFVTMGVYTFAFAAIKQTLAVAILLIATDRLINQKYLTFWILAFTAILFHPFSIIYFILPFMFFEPWMKKTYLLLGGAIIVIFSLSGILTSVIKMTETIGYQYSDSEFAGAGVNLFRVIVVWVPTILSFIVRHRLRGNLNKGEQLIINASMFNSIIMFVGLFGTANYFARLANYFLIFQTLSLPIVLRYMYDTNKKVLTFMSVIGYSLFFYYESYLVYGAFETRFSFMRLGEYLLQLLH